MPLRLLQGGIAARFFYQGEPASGAQVYFYESGTTTPKTVYTDAALTTPAANPMTANQNGEITAYLGNGEYTIRAETVLGALIDTEDGIFAVQSTDLTDVESGLGLTLSDVNTDYGAEDILRYLPEDQHDFYKDEDLASQNDNAVYAQRWLDVLSAMGIEANPTKGAIRLESKIYLRSNINAPNLNGIHFANRSTSGQDKQVFAAGTVGSEDANPDWAVDTVYAVGDRIVTAAGNEYYCTIGGTSASAPATGPSGTTTGVTETEGPDTLEWQYVGGAASYGNSLWGATLFYDCDAPSAGDKTLQITDAGDYSSVQAGDAIAIRSGGAELFSGSELTPYRLPSDGEINYVESISSGLITLRRALRKAYTDCKVHVVAGRDVRAGVLDANGEAPAIIVDTVFKNFRASQDPTITEWSVLSLGGMLDCDIQFTGWDGLYNGAALNAVQHCRLEISGEYEKRILEMAYSTDHNEYIVSGSSNATPEAKAAVTLSSREDHSRLELGTINHAAGSGAAISISGVGTGVEVVGGTVYAPNVTRTGIDFGAAASTSHPTQCAVQDTRFILGSGANRGIEIYGESGVTTGHAFSGVVIEGSAAGMELVYPRTDVTGCFIEVQGVGTYNTSDPIDNTDGTITDQAAIIINGASTSIQPDSLRTESFDVLNSGTVLGAFKILGNDPALWVPSTSDALRVYSGAAGAEVLKARFSNEFLSLDDLALIENRATNPDGQEWIDASAANVITLNNAGATDIYYLDSYAGEEITVICDGNSTFKHLDPTAPENTAWAATTVYSIGQKRTNDTSPVKIYECTTGGTSGATGPTGTGTGIADGTCVWDYVSPKPQLTIASSADVTPAENEMITFSATSGVGGIEKSRSTIAGGAGSGDVVGPASATDEAVARYNTTTGQLIQDSNVTIDDTGNVSIPASTAYQVNGLAILSDSAGTLTLSNVNAADATTVSTLEGALNHDNLTGFVANEHLDWTSASVGTIDLTNFPALTSANFWLGNVSNAATAVTMSGDATMDNAGAVTVTSASTGGAGKIEIATQAEVDAGTDSSRAVTPETLHDKPEVFGSMYIDGNTTDTTINTTNVWEKVIAGWTQGVTQGTTFTTDQIDLDEGGTYTVDVVFGIAGTGSGITMEFGISLTDATPLADSTIVVRGFVGTTLEQTAACSCAVSGVLSTDDLSFYCRNITSGSTVNIRVTNANFRVRRIGP